MISHHLNRGVSSVALHRFTRVYGILKTYLMLILIYDYKTYIVYVLYTYYMYSNKIIISRDILFK